MAYSDRYTLSELSPPDSDPTRVQLASAWLSFRSAIHEVFGGYPGLERVFLGAAGIHGVEALLALAVCVHRRTEVGTSLKWTVATGLYGGFSLYLLLTQNIRESKKNM